jgi:hypothetical protein
MQKPLTVLLGLLFLVGGGSAVWFTMNGLGAPVAGSRLAAVGGNLALSFIGYDEDGYPIYVEDEVTVDANGSDVWWVEEEEILVDDPSWWWQDDNEVWLPDDEEILVDDPSWWWEDDGNDEDAIFIEEEEIDIYNDIDEEIMLSEGWGPTLSPGEVEEVYIYDDEPVYSDDGYWEEYEVVEEEISEPWYVKAFPGIGSMFQQILPGQQTRVTPQPQPVQQRVIYPQPSCWISAQPSLVASRASPVLTWSSFNASRASLTGFGEVPIAGSRTVPNIMNTQTFTLSVAGQGGNGSCYTRITVQSPVSNPPSCIISANPDIITAGQSANIAWGSQNASSASISGVGAVPTQGGISVSPIQTTTYTLAVANSNNQSNTCATRVVVR